VNKGREKSINRDKRVNTEGESWVVEEVTEERGRREEGRRKRGALPRVPILIAG
jgi:hypothetical protein